MAKQKDKAANTTSITRSALNAGFIDALAQDWAENGAQVIASLRVTDAKAYSALVASLAPKLVEVTNLRRRVSRT